MLLLQLVQPVGALLELARFLIDPLLTLGQPGLPALQVAAELPDLVLDRPDLVLDLAARLGGLLGGGLCPADDGGCVRLGAGPDLAGLAVASARPHAVPRCASSCGSAGSAGRWVGARRRCRAGTAGARRERARISAATSPIASTSAIPLLKVRPFRSWAPPYRWPVLAVMPCSEEPRPVRPGPGQPGTGPPRGSHRRGCNVHAPGKVPPWLALLLASLSTLGPAGWWPMGPGRTHPAGPGGPLRATSPEAFHSPRMAAVWAGRSGFRCSLLILFTYA